MANNLTAISPTGTRLDAVFSLDRTDQGFDVTIESRSGSNRGTRPRNPDYEKLFELILQRVAALDGHLLGAWVASSDTAGLPTEERLLAAPDYPYPVDLSKAADLRRMRTSICGRQGAIGRRPGARGPGNRNKRVLLSFGVDQLLDEADQVDAVVSGARVGGDAVINELLTDTAVRTRSRTNLTALRALLEKYAHAAPKVRTTIGRQIERGWVGDRLKSAHQYRCQICKALNYDPQTFRKPDGTMYVEAHHVDPVSMGMEGALRPENVIVVCPSHHRELHYGAAARIVDHGDRFEIVVELGTAMVPKSDLLALLAAEDGTTSA